MTSCNPLFSTAERIIAYGVFDSLAADIRRSAGGDRGHRDGEGIVMYAALWRVLPGPVWVRIVHPVVLCRDRAPACSSRCVFPWVNDCVERE